MNRWYSRRLGLQILLKKRMHQDPIVCRYFRPAIVARRVITLKMTVRIDSGDMARQRTDVVRKAAALLTNL